MATNKLLQGMRKVNNYTRTENAALTHKSTLSDVLDFYHHVPARRGSDNTALFAKAYAENPVLALRAAFYLRDIRGKGTGERESFKQVLRWLHANKPNVFNSLVKLVPEYGRWDDILEFVNNKVVLGLVDRQLSEDYESDHPSLLTKWMPSSNTSSAKTRALAKQWINVLGMSDRTYRKMLSNLRRKINVLERLMSSNEFGAINYEHVPSKASKLYRKAFSKRDADRYVAYLEAVKKGEKKINASTLMPYEIVANYLRYYSYDATLEALWSALPNYCDTDLNILCVVDTSSSMMQHAITGNVYPMHVSIALGLYGSERNNGAFKDYVITFNDRPELVRVRGTTLLDRAKCVRDIDWGGSTNLQGTFDLILSTAVREKVPAEDMPSHLFIISDMEFNSACGNRTNFEIIKAKYLAAGYVMPKLVFWNVQSRNTQTPVTEDENGTMLVSGLSATVFKNAINAKTTTPYDSMLEVLNDERYAPVEAAVQGITL